MTMLIMIIMTATTMEQAMAMMAITSIMAIMITMMLLLMRPAITLVAALQPSLEGIWRLAPPPRLPERTPGFCVASGSG